jgi:hypothetical protein
VCGYVLLQTSVLHLFNIQLPRCRRYKGLTGCLHLDHHLFLLLQSPIGKVAKSKKQFFQPLTFGKTQWQNCGKVKNSKLKLALVRRLIIAFNSVAPNKSDQPASLDTPSPLPKLTTMLQSSSNLLRQRLQNPVLRLIASFSSSNAIQNDPYKFRPQTDSKVFDNRGELKEFKPMDIQAKMDKIFNGAEAEKEKKAMNVHSDGPMGVGILGK